MIKNPKVSIIIPVYNGSNYVREAIDSALAQTYKNIEIIVVNDGSKDNTEEICLSYGDKIKYYSKENGGVSTALNLALEKMTGDYFSWLSHDDLYYPNKVEENVKEIEENTIILSNFSVINENGKLIRNIIQPHELLKEHHEFSLLKGFVNGITLLVPKKAFDECGKFNSELKCTQDFDMWLRMYLKGYKFKHINKVLTKTRIHSQQTTNTSPRVILEGNKLWINIMESIPKETRIKINKNEYNFFRDMAVMLKTTEYDEAYKYSLEKLKELSDYQINLEEIKVSVIIPIKDESIEEIKKTIDSVLTQNKNNLEILLIDFSDDKNNKKDLTSMNSNIKYIKNKNIKNKNEALNIGIKESAGEYITFLNAKDEFLEGKINEQLKEIILTESNFSHTSYKIKETDEIVDTSLLNNAIYNNIIYDCPINLSTIMIKKEFIEKNNLEFNENLEEASEDCLWLKISLLAPVLAIDNCLTSVQIIKDKNKEKIKNTLAYVLSDPILSQYEDEIAKLTSNFTDFIIEKKENISPYLMYYEEYNKVINSISWKITKPLRLVSKTFKTLKKNGIKSTLAKIKRYFNKRG